MHFVRIKLYLVVLFYITFTSCSMTYTEKSKSASDILGDPNYQAICYGAYRTNSRDVQPTVSQIKEDLKILNAMGIKIIRTYNTKLDEIRNILKAISELKISDSNFEMYLMMGVWIECENAWTDKPLNHEKENEKGNSEEIQRAIELANNYQDIIKIISVGNEAMVHWASNYYVHPNIILKWVNILQELKKENKLPENLWITTSDNYASWGGADSSYHVEDLKKLYEAVDYVSIHTYPMHDTHYNSTFWGITESEKNLSKKEQIDSLMVRSLNYAKAQYKSVYNYMQSIGVNKPIHIGETGWASSSDGYYGSEGSKACDEYKAGIYYQLMKDWAKNEKITLFYFEAFDELWKDSKNRKGSENHFGLFTIDGKAKYAIWDKVELGLFENLTRDGNQILKTHDGEINSLIKKIEIPLKK